MLLVVALLSAGLVAAGPLARPAPALPAVLASEGQPDLDELMGGLKTNLKTLSQSLSSPGGAQRALVAVREMQVLSIAAKGAVPYAIAELPEAERAPELVAYQVEMARLLSELALLEVDVLQGRSEAALERVTGALRKLRDDSHDRWQ
ncbi:MAG: hypothetical protein DRQ55_09535 [Planctomycetota bacterium]|nr:MAG: hypothetical protein DRQ55_09535 [Planctomycetota bacterium]